MDECFAAGGYVEMIRDDWGTAGRAEKPECIVEDCGEYEYTQYFGTHLLFTKCDRACMLTGGEIRKEHGSIFKECYWGDSLQNCKYVVESVYGVYCDDWCAPNNGVMIDNKCVYDNITVNASYRYF